MVGTGASGAFGVDRLLCFVFCQTVFRGAAFAAYPADSGTGAICLVMAKLLAAITTERFWVIGAEVEGAPISQVEVRRGGASQSHQHLASFLLVFPAVAAGRLLHEGMALQQGKGQA